MNETENDDLQKVRTLKRDGCNCSLKCTSKFGETDMISHIYNIREIEKNDKDMYIMGTLVDFDKEQTKKWKKRKRIRKKFMFLGQAVCKNFFTTVYVIGRKSLKNLISHMDKNGAVPRTHGSIGKRMQRGLAFEDIRAAV